jgi:hypothetical protein
VRRGRKNHVFSGHRKLHTFGRVLRQDISPLQGFYLYRTIQTQKTGRHTSMPRLGLEPAIPVNGRHKTIHDQIALPLWHTDKSLRQNKKLVGTRHPSIPPFPSGRNRSRLQARNDCPRLLFFRRSGKDYCSGNHNTATSSSGISLPQNLKTKSFSDGQ